MRRVTIKNIIYLEIVISCVIDGANGMSLACKGKIAIVFQINCNNYFEDID